jgi:methyl-accepting chemotaxis protein
VAQTTQGGALLSMDSVVTINPVLRGWRSQPPAEPPAARPQPTAAGVGTGQRHLRQMESLAPAMGRWREVSAQMNRDLAWFRIDNQTGAAVPFRPTSRESRNSDAADGGTQQTNGAHLHERRFL